ncbi:MAG: hypothetical protein H8D23_23205 [Candidatus Brocadiales bacterium]|nr:hypothetical protein [Candidatus Brocadiales bacterium]
MNQFLIEVAQGLHPGYSFVHKFGEGTDIDTADGFVDLWDGAGSTSGEETYTWSANNVNDIDSISSADAGDTQDIEIQGLTSDGALVLQTATLNGRTRVALTTPLWRIFRMKNTGTSDNAGIIYCYVNGAITNGVPDTKSTIRAEIGAGNNQTLMALYTVPRGKIALMSSFYASKSKKITSVADVHLLARPYGGVFQIKHTATLASAGSSTYRMNYEVPQKFEEKTDILMRADASVNDTGVSGGFNLLLVNKVT